MSEAIVKPPVDLVKGWEEVRHCAQLIREGKARIVVTKKEWQGISLHKAIVMEVCR